MFPVSNHVGDRRATSGLELRHRRFCSVGSLGSLGSFPLSPFFPPELVSETFQFTQRGRGASSKLESHGRRPRRDELFHLSEVVSTMWTESRYPNTAALKPSLLARPIASSIAVISARFRLSFRSAIEARLVFSSGGKVTPANGQEHPRTEL